MHGGKNWNTIAALILGRMSSQCWYRWPDFLDTRIARANKRSCEWTTDEDIKLKDSVQPLDGKNWAAIAALVPGRAKIQCRHRWHSVLGHPSLGKLDELILLIFRLSEESLDTSNSNKQLLMPVSPQLQCLS
jgi:hypothetical protein